MGGQIAFVDFLHSAEAEGTPPVGLSFALTALWHDRRGQGEMAHTLAQEAGGKDGDWVHAYLHRKEGDEVNAGYWYRRAGRPICRELLPTEWEQLARALLADRE